MSVSDAKVGGREGVERGVEEEGELVESVDRDRW